MGKVPHETEKSDILRKKDGLIPRMAITSKGSIVACLDSSFFERVNLMANQAVKK